MGMSTLAWTLAFGHRAGNEGAAVLRVLGAFAVTTLAWNATALMILPLYLIGLAHLSNLILVSSPMGPTFVISDHPGFDRELRLVYLGVHLLTTAGMAGVWYWRWSRVKRRRVQAAGTKPEPAVLSPPLRSPTRALLWQTLREARLPVVVCLLFAVLPVGFIAVSTLSVEDLKPRWDILANVLRVLSTMAGVLLAMGLALSVFGPALEGRLPWFWRSRPIPVGRWYAYKLATSVALLILTFGLPIALLDTMFERHNPSYWYWLMPLTFLTVFSICLVLIAGFRHAVYGCLLGMVVSFSLMVLPELDTRRRFLPNWNPLRLVNSFERHETWIHWWFGGFGWFFFGSLAICAACFVASYRLIRRRV